MTSHWLDWTIVLLALLLASSVVFGQFHPESRWAAKNLLGLVKQKVHWAELSSRVERWRIRQQQRASEAPEPKPVPTSEANAAVAVTNPAPAVQTDSEKTEAAAAPSQPAASPASPSTPADIAIEGAATTETPPKPVATKPSQSSEVQATADVEFTSTPSGANVRIDGRSDSAWVTPFAIRDLKPGTHVVAWEKAGYLPQARELEISPGKSSYTTSLLVASATLSLSSDPRGASIEIDGQETGRTTPAKVNVEAGEHKIALKLKEYRSASTIAKVQAGQIFNYGPALQTLTTQAPAEPSKTATGIAGRSATTPSSEWATLEVRSTPPGAFVVMNGRNSGKLTPQKLSFPAGKYFLTLRLDGYKPVTRVIELESAHPLVINQALEKQ